MADQARENAQGNQPRDIPDHVEVANQIKSHHVEEINALKDKKVFEVEFPSLATSAVSAIALNKRLLFESTLRYVPDFLFIVDYLQLMYIGAKSCSAIKKNPACSLPAWTIYVCYALVYIVLSNISPTMPGYASIDSMLDIFRSCGFDRIRLPLQVQSWVQSVGVYFSSEIGRKFECTFGPPAAANDDYRNGWFYSGPTAHLLPNFRVMFDLIYRLGPNNPSNDNGLQSWPDIARNDPVRDNADTALGRLNIGKIPGLSRLRSKNKDADLGAAINTFIQLARPANESTLRRWLQLDPSILLQSYGAVQEFLNSLPTFTYSSSLGSPNVLAPIVHDGVNNLIAAQNVQARPAANAVVALPAANIVATPDQQFQVRSRKFVENGILTEVHQIPIVRVSNDHVKVSIGQAHPADPQPLWFNQEHEFATADLTLAAVHAHVVRR